MAQMSRSRVRSATRKPYLFEPNGGPLLDWYDKNKRDLPWRRTSDPYAIWVSEVMLQQTQVGTVISYWERWMSHFPTIQSLAEASEQDVLSLWQGLGYYRRCRLLLEGARWVHEHGIPGHAEAWRKVPGIGAYTAGAIASIAQQEPTPLVDGNVERVYSRITADPSLGTILKKSAWQWAETNLFDQRPGDWNQALMELGATICTPKNPRCEDCPVQERCVARQTWRTREFPSKARRPQVTPLTHVVWIPEHRGLFGVRQIPKGQWWEGMWEFPRIDLTANQSTEELETMLGGNWTQSVGTLKHAVTTHRITIQAFYITPDQTVPELNWLTLEELKTLPMPAPQRKLLDMVIKKAENGEINRSLET